VQIERGRTGAAEIMPQAFQLFPSGAGLPLRDPAVEPTHEIFALQSNREKLAELAWRKSGIGNELRYLLVAMPDIICHGVILIRKFSRSF